MVFACLDGMDLKKYDKDVVIAVVLRKAKHDLYGWTYYNLLSLDQNCEEFLRSHPVSFQAWTSFGRDLSRLVYKHNSDIPSIIKGLNECVDQADWEDCPDLVEAYVNAYNEFRRSM